MLYPWSYLSSQSPPRCHPDHASFTEEETGVEVRGLPQVIEEVCNWAGRELGRAEAACAVGWASTARLPCEGWGWGWGQAHTPLLWIVYKVAMLRAVKQDLPIPNRLGRVLHVICLGTTRHLLLKEKQTETYSERSESPGLCTQDQCFGPPPHSPCGVLGQS